MAAMLDDKTKRSVIQHGCHTIVFWISRDWLQTKNKLPRDSCVRASEQVIGKVIGSTPVGRTRIFFFRERPVSLTEKTHHSQGFRNLNIFIVQINSANPLQLSGSVKLCYI